MLEEETTLDENAEATLNGNEESEDTSFEELFADIEDDGDSDEAPVSREEFNNLIKGVKKLASTQGRLKKEVVTEASAKVIAPATATNSILKKLYAKESPEILTVWDEIVAEAPKGVDPIEYYEGKKGWQLEAKARHDAKTEEETNKSKIDKPSSGIVSSKKIDLSKVNSEDVGKLDPSQKLEWLKDQARQERNRID